MLPTTTERYFGQAFLDDIIEWISDNQDPDEVFEETFLIKWVKDNLTPDEVFDDGSLEEWARDNGYKEE